MDDPLPPLPTAVVLFVPTSHSPTQKDDIQGMNVTLYTMQFVNAAICSYSVNWGLHMVVISVKDSLSM